MPSPRMGLKSKLAQVKRRSPNTYTISVYLGRDENGKRKYHYETFYGKLTDAKLRASELETKLKRRNGPKAAAMTLGEYLQQIWLKRIKLKVAERTFETYVWHVRKLVEYAGHLHLYNLETDELEDALGSLESLSPKSIRGICATLRTALRNPAARKILTTDPTVGITTPRVIHKKRKTLTPEEHQELLKATHSYKHGIVIYLLAETGIRLGEALGLTWQDVNFSKRTITIRRSANVRHRTLNEQPKNSYSIRTIKINDALATLLKEHRTKQKDEIIRNINKDADLVSRSSDGRVLRERAIRLTLERVLKKAGITEHMRIHDLRHSAGSLLLENGYSLASVSEFLGHSNTSTTASVYTHAVRHVGCVSDTYNNHADKMTDQQNQSQ